MTVYSIWNQAVPTVTDGAPGNPQTYGTYFTLSQTAPLTGIWFYSSSVDLVLPDACGVYDVATGTIIAGTQDNAPSWSGALGSGWVKRTYDGSITLDTRTNGYAVAIHYSNVSHKGFTQQYAYPLTSGIITAPVTDLGIHNAPFTSGASLAFPGTDPGAANYDWFVDVEVTVTPPPQRQYLYQMRRMP